MITVKEAKVEKKILQAEIAKLISEFEITNGLSVQDVCIKERFACVGDIKNLVTVEVKVEL